MSPSERNPPCRPRSSPITVTATRNLGLLHGFYERHQAAMGGGQFITRGEIQRRAALHVLDLLRGMHRGRERCTWPLTFVDGVMVYDPEGLSARTTGQSAVDALSYLNLSDVEGVEYYQTALTAPAEFVRGNGRCPVLAVWTRRGSAPPEDAT